MYSLTCNELRILPTEGFILSPSIYFLFFMLHVVSWWVEEQWGLIYYMNSL